MDVRTECNELLKNSKFAKFEALALTTKFLWQFEFKKKNTTKICKEKAAGEQGLADQQFFFFCESFNFPKMSNCHRTSLFEAKGLKLGNFFLQNAMLSFSLFLASILKHDRLFLWLTRARDTITQRDYSPPV